MKEVQIITIDILKCLRFLKKVGIIHCDLKPENILYKLDNAKNVKVVDFGSATFIDDNDYDYLQTRPYRAPEISFGCKFDFTADIWSLGCIMYEIITSKVLFNYSTVQENLGKAFAINKSYSTELFADGTKKKKYLTNNGFIYVETGKIRNDVKEIEVIIPKLDFEFLTELKKLGCDNSLMNFVESCLALDPLCRLTVDEAFDHEFVKKNFN
jgi:serine/threonine protein kinase